MAEWVKVVILGIVEGITEFLPISSTGHLLIVSALLDFKDNLNGTFEIFIQLGAVIAVIGYYRRDIFTQVRTVRTDPNVRRFWLAIVIASIPAALIGLLVRETLKDTLFAHENAPYIVAPMLILGGIIFLIMERRQSAQTVPEETRSDLFAITPKQAFIIGLAQTTALIPGVSRSGASIVGGMLVGLNRQTATIFSFYLAIPVLGGATILDLLLSLDEIDGLNWVHLLLGTVISGIIAWIAIDWLLRYVAQKNFVGFGYYRISAGVVILFLVAVGAL
jgi:undecaprenyl-diphosphatase